MCNSSRKRSGAWEAGLDVGVIRRLRQMTERVNATPRLSMLLGDDKEVTEIGMHGRKN